MNQERLLPVTSHASRVMPGGTFVAIRGHSDDGTRYIAAALERGARCVIVESCGDVCRHVVPVCEWISGADRVVRDGVTYELTSNARMELARRSAQSAGYPAEKLKIIGVTGTKGKTTTTWLIAHILRCVGYKTALFGSIENQIGDRRWSSRHATEGSDVLQDWLRECVDENVTHVVLEISSHALALDRVACLSLEVACFLNLAPDHVDFHQTMDAYFAAKFRIFDMLSPSGVALINTVHDCGMRAHQLLVERFAQQERVVRDIAASCLMVEMVPSLPGAFNRENSAMALGAAEVLGVDAQSARAALAQFTGVPGRMEQVTLRHGIRAFIDYAHNAFALDAVLKFLREQTSHLTVVFGCGGNRDTSRRASMGAVAARYADRIILTDDNPRFEDPRRIVQDILVGIPVEARARVTVEHNREYAIRDAIARAPAGSIIAILGKGHQDTIEIGGKSFSCSDREIVRRYSFGT